MLAGELTLVTDAGPQQLTAGMCAGFPKGKADGHQLVNNGTAPAPFLEVGDRPWPDQATYSDADLAVHLGDKPGIVKIHAKGWEAVLKTRTIRTAVKGRARPRNLTVSLSLSKCMR